MPYLRIIFLHILTFSKAIWDRFIMFEWEEQHSGQGTVERATLEKCLERNKILRLNNIDNRMFLPKFLGVFQPEKRGKTRKTLPSDWNLCKSNKLFLIVCYEKCFCKSSDRGFFSCPTKCGRRHKKRKMVKLAFRFIKRRIFSFMTQKSLDLLSFFNFLL